MIIVKDDFYNHYEDIHSSNMHISLTDISLYRFLTDFVMQKVFLDNYLIIYVSKGEVTVRINKDTVCVSEKCLLFVPPYRVVQMWGKRTTDTVFYTVDFSCDSFAFFEANKYICLNQAGLLEVPVTELYSDFKSGEYFQYTKDAKLMIILVNIGELLKPKSNNRQLVEKVIECINENIMLQFDLDSLSEKLNYNKDYLSRAFKKEMGISVNNYINAEKIRMSKKLLNNSDMSIADIAKALGWDESNKFLKFFKYHEKITPSQYRDKSFSHQ